MKKDEASNEITEKKRKRGCTGRFLAFLFTFLIGVAVGLGASYYILVQQQSDSDAEQRAYAALENSTESRDYKNFLERFPSSGYASDVKSRMEKLQQMEAEWSRISTSKKVADFEAFRKQFQHPYYDNAWTQPFAATAETPAIGTMVILTGTWQDSTIQAERVEPTPDY